MIYSDEISLFYLEGITIRLYQANEVDIGD